MKKLLLISLTALLLAACGKEEATVEVKNDEAKQEVKKEETEKKEVVNPEGEATTHFQLVVDNENIKATIVGVEKKVDEFLGETFQVKFELENKRTDTIMFGAEEIVADGKPLDDNLGGMGQEVGPGKKTEGYLTVVNVETGEIPDIKEVIEFNLVAFSFDDSDYEEIHEAKLELKK